MGVTTSTLTPLVGLGIIPLYQMYPLTLGANIGTTVTGLLAAGVSGKVSALQVALAHLFFYPIPFMRRVPINAARFLGRTTRMWKGFPAIYILICFFHHSTHRMGRKRASSYEKDWNLFIRS